MPNILKLFKKPDTDPLPMFPKASIGDIPAASCLLFYGGNKLTELVGERIYDHPFHPPAFHAALTVGEGMFLNVGAFRTLERYDRERRTTRRIDAIVYDMPEEVRRAIAMSAFEGLDKPHSGFQLPTYSFKDYVGFAFKIWKADKRQICSENVVQLLRDNDVECATPTEPSRVAPWMLLEWALENHDKCYLRTLWVGEDFKKLF